MRVSTILFVCTGNICRSPLAEAVARRELVSHFGVDDLASVGIRTASAGIFAQVGSPATPEMQDAAREIGLDLTTHRATQLVSSRPSGQPSLVYAMDNQQVEWIRSELSPPNVGLLGQAEIDDPYGSSPAFYRRTRDEIVAAVLTRLPEMVAVVPGPFR